jgi:hypothetical protein
MSDPNDVSRLLSGRYRVLRQLGEGGMGVIYLAHDKTLDCEVVIKMPLRSALAEPGFVDRFTREIRSMVVLAHPHVVKIQDVGNHDGVPFCVMQYLSGGSLHDRPMPADPPTLRQWLPAVATALDFVHCQGFLHRDIKPANILFDGHGNAYISDFGVAKVLSAKAAHQGATQPTGEGLVVGTVGYLAPELIMGAETVNGRADQYALAATVYQVLAGRLPFEGNTLSAVLVKQAAGKMPPLQQFAPHLPKGMAEAIESGLSKDSARRYPDCAAFAEAVLRPASSKANPPRPAPAGPTETPTKPPSATGRPAPQASAQPAARKAGPAGDDAAARPARRAGPTATANPASRSGGRRQGPTAEAAERGGRVALLVAAVVLTVGAAVGGVFALRALRPRPGPAPPAPATAEAFHFKMPGEVTVQPGTSRQVPIRIVRIEYEGPVRVTCSDRVPGVSLSEGTIGPGQREVTLRLEVTDGASGLLNVPLQGLGDGIEQSVVLPLRVLPPPELKVQLPTNLPPLRPGGDVVIVRLRVLRVECADQAARFSVNTNHAPPGVLVTPTSGGIPPGKDGFTIRVQANTEAVPGKVFLLPITVLLRQPTRKLEKQVELELRVDPSSK